MRPLPFSIYPVRLPGKLYGPNGDHVPDANAEEGAAIINNSGLKVFSAVLLKDAARLVSEVLK